MKIIWGSEYELGIPLIDRQHHRIVDYINTLDRLIDTPDAALGVERVLYDLVDYTESHFGFEEALMKEAGYASLDEHRETHQAFAERIEEIQRSHRRGEDVADMLVRLLERWLLHHILEEDAGYRDTLNALIDRLGPEGLGAWVNEHFRLYFRHP